MRRNVTLFPILALCAAIAYGQTAVYHFAHTEGRQNIQEIATAIRNTADIKDLQADVTQKTLAVNGTAEQLALAEWLFHELDKPQMPAPNDREEATHQYLLQGGAENTVRIFYMPNPATVQEFQEAATVVRVTTDMPRVFTYTATRAVIARGTPDQIALAAWLVDNIGHPSGQEYQLPMTADRFGEVVVRVFPVRHADSQQSLNEVGTLVRNIANIRRVFYYTFPRSLVVRSDARAVALFAWLLDRVDVPAAGTPGAVGAKSSETYQYDTPYDRDNDRDNLIRVFYLPTVATVQDFQQIATNIRNATKIRRVYTYNQPRAVALRGTIDQLAQAELIIKQIQP